MSSCALQKMWLMTSSNHWCSNIQSYKLIHCSRKQTPAYSRTSHLTDIVRQQWRPTAEYARWQVYIERSQLSHVTSYCQAPVSSVGLLMLLTVFLIYKVHDDHSHLLLTIGAHGTLLAILTVYLVTWRNSLIKNINTLMQIPSYS